MTNNEQIIIDGVDVSGCDFLAKEDDYCSYSGITYAYKGQCMCSDEEMCKEHPNCFYKKNLKKLKRKEQECEKLETARHLIEISRDNWEYRAKSKERECESLNRWLPIISRLEMDFGSYEKAKAIDLASYTKQIFAELDQLKKQHEADKGLIIATGKMNYQLLQEYDKLKTENDELRQFLSKEPLAIQALQKSYESYQKSTKVFSDWVKDYKQLITEIKEIAEKRNYLDYNECLDDILQKISEVEDEYNG